MWGKISHGTPRKSKRIGKANLFRSESLLRNLYMLLSLGKFPLRVIQTGECLQNADTQPKGRTMGTGWHWLETRELPYLLQVVELLLELRYELLAVCLQLLCFVLQL